MNVKPLTWEEAITWLRSQPERAELVRDCYFDDPITEAAERFSQGEEWQAVATLLAPYLPGRVLDLGAGRGIATCAFAKLGCQVTAIEPDPSPLVGRGAITSLLRQSGQKAEILAAAGEDIPCADASFDLVYGRAVLHHASDLEQLCQEAARVLRRGGVFLATREHVLSRYEDLPEFLANHPLHALYGGENAYVLDQYLAAMTNAGLSVVNVMGPFDTPINYAPLPHQLVQDLLQQRLTRIFGRRLAKIMVNRNMLARLGTRILSARCQIPGRHYSFLAFKR